MGKCSASFAIAHQPGQAAFSVESYPLCNSALLDSASTIHIFNQISRFLNFRRATKGDFLWAGESQVPIQGYGDVDIRIEGPQGPRCLRLTDVAFCENFACNLVSYKTLKRHGIWWDESPGQQSCLRASDWSIIGLVSQEHDQFVLEHIPSDVTRRAFFNRRNKYTSITQRSPQKVSAKLWHLRLGHPGPRAMEHLVNCSRGVKIKGIPPPLTVITAASGFAWDFYLQDRKTETVKASIEYLLSNLKHQYEFITKIVECDNELTTGKPEILNYLVHEKFLKVEPSAPNTQCQNGLVWIPLTGEVILTRDVVFDEDQVFDGTLQSLAESNDEISSLMTTQAPDEPVFDFNDDDEQMVDPPNEEQFNEKYTEARFELLPTPPQTPPAALLAASIQMIQDPFVERKIQDRPWWQESHDDLTMPETSQSLTDGHQDGLSPSWTVANPISKDKTSGKPRDKAYLERLIFKKQIDRKDLPPLPKSHHDLKTHTFRYMFEQAERDHLQSHQKMGSWKEVALNTISNGTQILDCMWIYVYKYTKRGRLVKCKARLVTVPHEPCCLTLDGIFVFFYVDDIVFAFRKEDGLRAKL
ncbi:GAG-pre-integrase domain-containing protein [Hirsutella rhossiliensis]|uniref:GAG-pre-integrase domain-containing protein n=1 Tax=Hirsutella rhossiliensis TaxID=111463 RepID=A0A9P8SEQ1_9HYPO|nr:GAG-pre-integrase domain-containing protein [Hirsutella rhossiliensis]KAH0959254.1 GAG-pre-integrase domain-containing protein [Hirsutella rhossiliensis]